MANMVQVTNMFNYDNEIGTSQKPPKLLSLADYPNWKDRFVQFVSFTDTSLWIPILEGYTHPTYSWMGNDNVPKTVSILTTEEKQLFDREKKAMASISIRDVKKSRKELLKKQFLVFKHFQNESLDDLATRFYHLPSELSSASVVYETEEINDKFLESLPSKFDVYSKKETNMEHIQDPAMYFAKTSGKTGTGVAFFSSDGQDNSSEHVSGVSSQTGFSVNTSTSSSGSHNTHSFHMNQRVDDDYLAMFSSFMASYENFIRGKIHDPDVLEEDFCQIDLVDF
ncbi:hypothetical protein L1987_69486 [Smallanthus sonchifolius]|uniref:Uncharacterized protein n=1 Tax=Smallanthus sonchifolius TaxID=185202 RepID=A0ACB9B7Y7_9ASTR|nr:hypothetical protein L1987_69486 [Smallanthus sonchifolius]